MGEVVDLAGYRMARRYAEAAKWDDEFADVLDGMGELYRRKARKVLRGGEPLQRSTPGD